MINTDSFISAQMYVVSAFGSIRYILYPAIFLVFYFLVLKGHRREAFFVLLSTLSFIVSQVLKGVFQSPRPGTAILEYMTNNDVYGFPSGHVLFYTAFFGFLIYLTFKLKKIDKLLRKVVFWISLYFILLVGPSRVFLGAHFMIDVIGGYVFGFLYLLFIVSLDKRIKGLETI